MEISFERTDYLKTHLILNTIYHVHNRKCKLCKIDIEDVCHFLLQCPKLEIERKEYKNFNSLDINNKCIWLMSSEDDFVIQHLYKLLYNLNIKKQSILADGV
jgi:hypothetical protein